MTNLSTAQRLKKIQIIDLASSYQLIKSEIEKVVLDVLASGQYILGPNVALFEQELSKYLGAKYTVSCANGTDALVLSLMALGIKPGDEVITVSHSFFATSEAIALVGAKPVFVDIQENDFNIDSDKIEKLITKNTKAIIPVHLYGQPCDILKVVDIARKHNLFVIEDCAQAVGAKLNGNNVGMFGDIGTISFFPTKNLGAFGDGGAIVTNNEELANKIRQLRFHGSLKRYVHDYIGLNSRLDEIQAAVLRVKLKYLDEWNCKRQTAAEYYNKLFKDIKGVVSPQITVGCHHIFHQYTIRLKNRDFVYEKLKEAGIEALIYYPIPIHLQKAFSHLGYKKGALPVTEKTCNEIVSLPIYPEIQDDDQKYIAGVIKLLLKE